MLSGECNFEKIENAATAGEMKLRLATRKYETLSDEGYRNFQALLAPLLLTAFCLLSSSSAHASTYQDV